MQPPSLPKPSATYVAAARAAKGGGEPSRPPEETFDSALCITGGGLVPPTELYGVFRGLAHKEALDNFDTIAGASGGYIASMMYTYSKVDTATYLDTDRGPDPQSITREDMCNAERLVGTYGGIITAPCCSFCPMPCPPLSRPGIGPLCPSQGGGILNGGPAMCGPPPGGCPCCVPLGVWAFCIDPALGVPLRVLSCGKISGPACFPLSGWGGAWGAGQSAIWDQFMVQYFMMKIMGPDYEKGKYTAASEQQAEQLAQRAKDRGCDGQDISDYVWPKEGKPTPLGIATLSDLSNYWSWQFTEPMKKWRLNAWKDPLLAESSEALPDYSGFVCLQQSAAHAECGKENVGPGVKAALENQWKEIGIGGAKGACIIPYMFTPQSASTKYSAKGGADDEVVIPPVLPCLRCFGEHSEAWCFGIGGTKARFGPTDVWARDFVHKPVWTLCGQIPGPRALSAETTMAMSGDAFGMPTTTMPCLDWCWVGGEPILLSLRIKTTDSKPNACKVSPEQTCLFTDGGATDSTAIIPAVAKGAKSVVAVLTNIEEGIFPKGEGRFTLKGGTVLSLASLFGVVNQKLLAGRRVGRMAIKTGGSGQWGIINQIFSNAPGDFDQVKTKQLLGDHAWCCMGLSDTSRPFDVLTAQFNYRQQGGKAIAGGIKGLHVMDNCYYGTDSNEGSNRVDLAVILMAPPKRWMDGINRNPELNMRAADYESKYPQYPPTDKTTGEEIMDPNHWRDSLFSARFGKAPYKQFPYTLGAFPLWAQTVATVNLAGYMGAR